MRILHINSYYQTGIFYKNLFDRQVAMGEEIDVYAPTVRGFDPGAKDFGAYARLEPAYQKIDSLSFHWKQHKLLRGALAGYQPGSYALFHAHSLMTNGAVAYALHCQYGVPFVVAVRDADVNVILKRQPHLRPLMRRILKAASKVVFLSPGYQDHALAPYVDSALFEEVKMKSAVIPNGIDALWLNQVPPIRTDHGNAPIELLFVGRIIPRKNLPAAIRAAEVLASRGKKVRLTVVGEPEDPSAVEAAKAHPLVRLMPPRPMAELMPLYQASDAFLLPSRRETFGLVYAEAISQGLPVLYTRGQGFDGQFEDGAVGYAVDPDDPKGMADRVAQILQNRPRMSAEAVEGSRKFDWDRIAETYRNLYAEVIR